MKDLCCETPEKVKELLLDEEISENLSFFFKTFSEPIRIKILLAMLHTEICVQDLAILLEVSQPRVSNQLKLLKLNKLVKFRKEKNNIYYSLDDKHIQDILNIGLDHINHKKLYKDCE
ncbi:hypothetical protein AN640_04685 [Candidatus Epulonipiscium fishelsonii]|uniref:Uncharacterized protein n=1 Tax=Candidatus Epulonipiscium fishelsonii TaxID=77094 RepID=A0ACC8XIN8_9FIRM|nr:hypothetical protein AN640_04685 [Epulopiscium sp. SCG-D08WGA-EpuloA1]OON95143.1 MAG: hypothetical protein ATN32_07340 [Epulopiscium sp. AS2M-Bin002]